MSDLLQNHRIEETPSGYRTIRPPRPCLEASLRLLADLAFRLLVRLAATQVGCVHLARDTRENRKRKQADAIVFKSSSVMHRFLPITARPPAIWGRRETPEGLLA